jgi:ubiquinone/menaquinone biosynthesis C-methylase UbiE
VTFHERGFVAASSPAALLARHNYETARIARELDRHSADRSLEVGCGFGRLSMHFAKHAHQHVAVDINDDALEMARAAYPHLTFERGSVLGLPFPDAHFDTVVSWTVIQHVRPADIEAACRELRRVLAPGGLLLLCEETPYGESAHSWGRDVAEYERMLAPLQLLRHGYVEEIDRLPAMRSPGEVMVFQA